MLGGLAGFAGRFTGNKKPPATTEVGTSGIVRSGGHLVSRERNPKAKGDQKWRTYFDLLANISIVSAGTRAFLNLIAKATWTLVPADTDNEADAARAQEAADLVLAVMHDLRRPWSRVVRRAAMYRFDGFSIQEWTAKKRSDGAIGLLDIAPRPAPTIDRWDTDKPGNVLGVTQVNPETFEEVYLPRKKIVYLVDDALSDSPEGLGLFRHLIESQQRLQRYEMLEAIGFETDLKGIPVGRAPYGRLAELELAGTITAAERLTILKPLEDFIKDHIRGLETGIVLDSVTYKGQGEGEAVSSTAEWDLSLLQGTPGTAAEVAAAINRITREMALVLGVQGLLLGGDGSGSLALGRVFETQFALIVDSSLGELGEAFEADIIATVMRLNGIPEELWPTFATEQPSHLDVEQISQSLVDVANAGAPLDPDDPIINALRRMIGMPEVDLDARAEAAALLGDALEQDDPTLPPTPPTPDPDEIPDDGNEG